MARKYQKGRRAELEDATRLRITEALVELHGTIGPAQTTIRAIAARAGVQRATVYRHFPNEAAMFAACSSHWAQENPFPDPAEWMAVKKPGVRLRTALGDMYSFYARNEPMLGNLFRDVAVVDGLRPFMKPFKEYLDSAGEAIVVGRGARDSDASTLRAAVGHALSFSTWRSLIRENELPSSEAITLMAGMVEQVWPQ